ncbi:hypothetical protein C7B81_14420 [Aphanothece cf. minutissima CCALA 015]|uniref:SPOR domain-containing protein n=1 Tax=Aphanothece cf. minutissima CCALA 015 TaxID=2107695 RepID=A0ABX5F4B3_9CHRO|nr:hypothetical protein C7B81_14420 [Aphanothece cf. minutissima CCALA 015]
MWGQAITTLGPATSFDDFPRQILVGAERPVVFEQKSGWYALHGEPLPTSEGLLTFEPEAIALLPGTPSAPLAAGQSLSPVYAQPGTGALAVPTGQLFIRFRPGESAQAHRAALEQAGCRIVAVPDHAPEAAWLRARHGDLAEALGCVARLRQLEGVASVEPQLLMARGQR